MQDAINEQGRDLDNTPTTMTTESVVAAYSRFVPRETLGLMGKTDITHLGLGDYVEKIMTILFSDIRNFSALSEDMTPRDNFAFINNYLKYMEPVITRNSGIIDKYLGDGIMALFPTTADNALHGAIEMLQALDAYNAAQASEEAAPLRIGIGLNTGLMMLGVVGGEKHMESTVISDAVNLAARIETMTKQYGVPLLISEHTYYGLVNASHHDTRFIDRVLVKGKKQPQSVYEVFDADPPALREAKRATAALFGEAVACYHFKEADKALNLLEKCLQLAPDDTVAQTYRMRCQRYIETGYHDGTGEVDLNIEWTDAFAIGQEQIDAQHHELFDRVANFVEGIRENHDYSQIQNMLEFLDRYIANHFATEEACMTRCDYPFLALQQEQHRRFCKYFAAFKEEVQEELHARPALLLFRTQILLIDWLVHHVAKLDRHFGKFLCRQETKQ